MQVGRFAVRRRRALEDTLIQQQAEQHHLGIEEEWLRSQLGQISPDPGPEHTWDRTLARAADAAGRLRELDQARAQDRGPRIVAQEDLYREMRQARQDKAQVDELATELARREAMTTPQRGEEHQARQQYLDMQQPILEAAAEGFVASWWADPASEEQEQDLGYGHLWSSPSPSPSTDHGYGPEL